MAGRLTRRQFVSAVGGLTLGAAALPSTTAWAGPLVAAPPLGGEPAAGDGVAAAYYQLLLRHTNWVEQQWNAVAGHYSSTNFAFAVVLGNAVLLTHGNYDATVAGVDAATLKARTIATISHFAGSNVLTGGTEWGETMFFDTTFELYFVLAAKLLWADLDAATRTNVDTIAAGQAAYTAAIGSGNDPRSIGWSPNGLRGGWVGDTKVDEMAVYAQCLGPAVAWLPGHADIATWRRWLNTWLLNDSGLPAADLANPTVVDGRPISGWNTAHNIFDTFLVENHGSFEPHYQLETWRMSGRVAAHFLAAGQPMPTALTAKPNGTRLWQTIRRVQSDSGEPFMPCNGDRYHLFGRDVLPLAFLAQIMGDQDAARAEANMATQLGPYQLYPPTFQLTKFSGEAKYEPEARAEIAISYLFHVWRAQQGGPVVPVGPAQFFAAAAGTTDYGDVPGLLAQNSATAFAATVSKPGFVKFVYAPNHDDWLFDVAASTPSLLPSTAATVTNRYAVAYSALRDGFDATAALLRLSGGHAGFATLPSGAVVYATSGTGAGEGTLSVFNLAMPGIAGLNGTRTYTGAGGAVTVAAGEVGAGGTNDLTFPAVSARYVRMLGVRPATGFGYSIFEMRVFATGGTTDLAVGRPTTASSATPAFPPANATDGDPTTRWAVAVADRAVDDSWLQVDLGAVASVGRVTIVWEAAFAAAFAVQSSVDGSTWRTAATVPATHTVGGDWVNVDGRAGFVVRGSANPITVSSTGLVLSDGPASGAAGMVVEGYPAQQPSETAVAAARATPSSSGPAALAASVADGHLSLFNLGDQDITAVPITLPRGLLYRGRQITTGSGSQYVVTLGAATARVEAPRFALSGSVPVGLAASVDDSRHVTLTAPTGAGGMVTVTSSATGERHVVALLPGGTTRITFVAGRSTPTADLALGRTTYPTSPLPPGMSDPGFAVDGDPGTAWLPGAGTGGRMVVDLGASLTFGTVALTWTPGRVRPCTVSVSADGLTYTQIGGGANVQTLTVHATGRYLALAVSTWTPGDAGLTSLSLLP
jgi:hypothetical protein